MPTASTLQVALQNQTNSNTVYAFFTGNAVDNNNALFLLQADGRTPYYPASPSRDGTALAANCAIKLGPIGSTTTVTIPRIAAARLWFSINTPLTFLLNPGPGLVEPTVANPNDPNINIQWDFCEFTFNSSQIYANITHVDFFSLPISLTLQSTSGTTQHVSGLGANSLTTVASQLQAQDNSDRAGWSKLISNGPSGLLRILSPNIGITLNSSLFAGYFEPYVTQVWNQYTNSTLSVDTQAQWGTLAGRVTNNVLTFANGGGSFSRPSTANIFSNSSGPFAVVNAEQGAVAARLAAAFNRSTLLTDSKQPDGETPSIFYKNPITNHYARILHANSLDGKGYAFPYDDVTATGGQDQSGFLADGSPRLWTVAVGGRNASAAVEQATAVLEE